MGGCDSEFINAMRLEFLIYSVSSANSRMRCEARQTSDDGKYLRQVCASRFLSVDVERAIIESRRFGRESRKADGAKSKQFRRICDISRVRFPHGGNRMRVSR